MARPEIDDEYIEILKLIIDESRTVPLPSDELSVNQMFRILVMANYSELQTYRANDSETELAVDQYDTSDITAETVLQAED